MVHLAASSQNPLKWSLKGRASKGILRTCQQSLRLQTKGQLEPVGNGPVGNLFGDTYANGKISPPIRASLNTDAGIPLGLRHKAKLQLFAGKGFAQPIYHSKCFTSEFQQPSAGMLVPGGCNHCCVNSPRHSFCSAPWSRQTSCGSACGLLLRLAVHRAWDRRLYLQCPGKSCQRF